VRVQRASDGGASCANVEFLEDVLDVLSDGMRRDDEDGGNLSGCVAGSDQVKDLCLTRRQRMLGIGRLSVLLCAGLHLD
jgi:hypothetical protein